MRVRGVRAGWGRTAGVRGIKARGDWGCREADSRAQPQPLARAPPMPASVLVTVRPSNSHATAFISYHHNPHLQARPSVTSWPGVSMTSSPGTRILKARPARSSSVRFWMASAGTYVAPICCVMPPASPSCRGAAMGARVTRDLHTAPKELADPKDITRALLQSLITFAWLQLASRPARQ